MPKVSKSGRDLRSGTFTSTKFWKHSSGAVLYNVHQSCTKRWERFSRRRFCVYPNHALANFLAGGFVRLNDLTEQLDNGPENPTDDQTIDYYNQNDIPFYYDLAQKFVISDRYFASLLGPTFPNRSYLMAATS